MEHLKHLRGERSISGQLCMWNLRAVLLRTGACARTQIESLEHAKDHRIVYSIDTTENEQKNRSTNVAHAVPGHHTDTERLQSGHPGCPLVFSTITSYIFFVNDQVHYCYVSHAFRESMCHNMI
jgi:hypothetical protein